MRLVEQARAELVAALLSEDGEGLAEIVAEKVENLAREAARDEIERDHGTGDHAH